MTNEDISTEFSRNLARVLFPNTSRGRTISQMAADGIGTNTGMVHLIGAGIIGAILVGSKK